MKKKSALCTAAVSTMGRGCALTVWIFLILSAVLHASNDDAERLAARSHPAMLDVSSDLDESGRIGSASKECSSALGCTLSSRHMGAPEILARSKTWCNVPDIYCNAELFLHSPPPKFSLRT